LSKKFEGTVAVVTGGSAGMGLATAKRFVQEGMEHVFITVAGRNSRPLLLEGGKGFRHEGHLLP
jgi:NAD(P)-dependent dehydrogenase (short-subunit alcohol dehydrogenase family)